LIGKTFFFHSHKHFFHTGAQETYKSRTSDCLLTTFIFGRRHQLRLLHGQ
jgi:hypothetical protein